MPASTPMPTKNPGDVLTSTLWNSYLRDNIDKLLTRGHRVLTVAQFAALTGPEGTKGTVAPDEVYLEVDATNGIQWHLAYESGEATYKWRFLGGPPLVSEVLTTETVASTGAYIDLTTVASITVPRAGDHDIEAHAGLSGSSANGTATWMAAKIGAAATVDNDGVQTAVAAVYVAASFNIRRNVAAASTVVKLQHKNAATAGGERRRLLIRPVRLV